MGLVHSRQLQNQTSPCAQKRPTRIERSEGGRGTARQEGEEHPWAQGNVATFACCYHCVPVSWEDIDSWTLELKL